VAAADPFGVPSLPRPRRRCKMDGIVKRVAVAVLLLALLGVTACGEDGGEPQVSDEPAVGEETARALHDIEARASRIEKGLTPAPCGTEAMSAMKALGDLIREHLHRGSWPFAAEGEDGPYPKDPVARRAAVDVVCRSLPLMRNLADCHEAEIRGGAMAYLSDWRLGGAHAGANWPPEWDDILKVYRAEFDHFVRLAASPDPFVAWCALELVVRIEPRAPETWRLVERGLAGKASIDPDRTADAIGAATYPRSGHFTPLLMDAALRPQTGSDHRVEVHDPFEVEPSRALTAQMRAALRDGDREQRVSVLRAVATPLCVDFLASVLVLVEDEGDDNMSADAAQAIAGMGRGAEAALPAMVRALARDDRRLRINALQALTAFGVSSVEAVDAILAVLRRGASHNDYYLMVCIDALGACGRGVPSAAAALRGLIKHQDPKVRDRAKAALDER